MTGFGPEGSEHNGYFKFFLRISWNLILLGSVSDTYSKFLQLLFDIASHQLQKFKDEDKKLALEEIENYVGKKLCLKYVFLDISHLILETNLGFSLHMIEQTKLFGCDAKLSNG